MNIFYKHTKTILFILTILNIGVHLTGFYYGKGLFSLFSTLVIFELLLIAPYLIITIYKWIESDVRKIQTEQVNLTLQVSRLHNTTLERIEKLETETLNRISSAEETNLNSILSQKESILNAINSLNEQANQSKEENKNELKLIQSALEKIDKLSEDSVEKVTQNNENLKSLEKVVNQEANKLNQNLSQHINSKDLELKTIVEDIQETIEIFREKIKNEKLDQNSNFKNLETTLLNEINPILSEVNNSKIQNTDSCELIIENIKRLKSETEQLIHNELDSFSNKQSKNISATELGLKKDIHQSSDNQYFKLKYELNNTYARLDSLASIYHLLEFEGRLPVMHNWTVSSDYAAEIVNKILINKGGNILDIGSGISTIIFGAAVKKCGEGKVISLEHSKEYYEKTMALIKEHNLEDICELHYSPLKEYVLDGKKWLWYDIEKVEFPKEIDIISVDGPPGETQHLARYPALPILIDRISSKTIVFLDDANREEEKEIGKLWENELGLMSEYNNLNKGVTILTKK